MKADYLVGFMLLFGAYKVQGWPQLRRDHGKDLHRVRLCTQVEDNKWNLRPVPAALLPCSSAVTDGQLLCIMLEMHRGAVWSLW